MFFRTSFCHLEIRKKPLGPTGCQSFRTIGQALAPCLPAGCRAVNELVSRALFMAQLLYHILHVSSKRKRIPSSLALILIYRFCLIHTKSPVETAIHIENRMFVISMRLIAVFMSFTAQPASLKAHVQQPLSESHPAATVTSIAFAAVHSAETDSQLPRNGADGASRALQGH